MKSLFMRLVVCGVAVFGSVVYGVAEDGTKGDAPVDHPSYFGIRVVDDATGRGVPLVELKTVHGVRYYTDSNGWVAIGEPELMGRRVFFFISSHGYEFPKDRFGFRGLRVEVEAGKEMTIRIKRLNLAERLYRVTGAGIYRDSVLLRKRVPIDHPVLNAGVCGSDSVVSAEYRGKIFWFWGDTNRLSYPLGNFHVPGAVSNLPDAGGLDPSAGVELQYFVDRKTRFALETARMPGKGPTWINGLTVLTDRSGRPRLLTGFVKVKPPLTIYARGIAEFSDALNRFEPRVSIPADAPLYPHGHPLTFESASGDHVYFCSPYPYVRVRRSVDEFLDVEQYEAYTYYKQGSTAANAQLDRDANGNLIVGWKRHTPAPTWKREQALLRLGLLKRDERLFVATDIESRNAVSLHGGSVAWNAYRQRWIMIAVSSFDRSPLGEVWYGESRRLEGPWKSFRRIVTHDRYSFYNPKHHQVFDQDEGRIIYFEGTYTKTFSGNRDATPRYDYNQIMYRLDLADPRLTQVR